MVCIRNEWRLGVWQSDTIDCFDGNISVTYRLYKSTDGGRRWIDLKAGRGYSCPTVTATCDQAFGHVTSTGGFAKVAKERRLREAKDAEERRQESERVCLLVREAAKVAEERRLKEAKVAKERRLKAEERRLKAAEERQEERRLKEIAKYRGEEAVEFLRSFIGEDMMNLILLDWEMWDKKLLKAMGSIKEFQKESIRSLLLTLVRRGERGWPFAEILRDDAELSDKILECRSVYVTNATMRALVNAAVFGRTHFAHGTRQTDPVNARITRVFKDCRQRNTILRPRAEPVSLTVEERTRFIAATLERVGIAQGEALSQAKKAAEKFETRCDDPFIDPDEDDDDVHVFGDATIQN